MKKLNIAIIDCIGLNYDGTTLEKKGIGGSESSIISIARELVKIGFDVSIFNDCDTAETQPGTYDGVVYRPIRALGNQEYHFDIVISQRTVIPFTPIEIYDQVKQPEPRDYDPRIFKQVQRPSQLKIVWMQDTFIWGDHLLETLVVNRHIDEVFNISDWHISYTTNSTHGPRRNYEVLKSKIFHTRNAINRWLDWVDIKKKDPNLFVYNASITKGMIPLVTKIWPKLKQHLPHARLKIIGGYYKFRDEQVSEAQQQVINLMKSVEHDPSIVFTGIIPQPKIAEIMAEASYNLYPGAYPETSGISTIESINYNTPIIGTRFGAMEESGTELASYFIDYAIEPNGLFPWINTDQQVDRYVQTVLNVVSNPYLHQQKQYACNAIKDVSTWDTVALQWKQHFYAKKGLELTAEEAERVEWINYRVHKTFGRRTINPEEIVVPNRPADELVPLHQRKVRMAIIDIVGMAYDGDVLKRKGMGGSESAVILVSKQLAALGLEVTVYNACDEEDYKPGTYDGVIYKPLSEIANDPGGYDVVISSRVVTPFIPEPWYSYPQTTNRKFDYANFKRIRESAKLKVFWMHDTFCWGDDILEDLVVNGAIDEIWTLSDFHAMYVMNCSHPRMRNYEVLRRHMWTTRNGIVKYFDSVDLDAKDPNLYIFNANMSKGLAPLLNNVWPKVKAQLPDARLTVIGGHYKLGAAFAHNDEETEFMKIVTPYLNDPTITFTGIIPQQQVAEISAKASWFIYPASLPETYGISTVEALYANTLLLTNRFGALEETATDNSWMIDYAIAPNGLFPNINLEQQTDKFVAMVVAAAKDPAEYRRRQLALNDIKDLVGWEVTALEWKQHIYKRIGQYLSRSESRMARYTKSKYHKVFNRRFSTEEEWLAPYQKQQKRIVVISPFYNAEQYVARCIASVAAQDYDNYEHILIDDASTDLSVSVVKEYIKRLPNDIRSKFRLIENKDNKGAVYNQISQIRQQESDSIIMLLDGDDSLVGSPDIFHYYSKIHTDYDFTYGSCWSMADRIPLISQPYPPDVLESKDYKNYRFTWNMPYTHLRTFKAGLLKDELDSRFQDSDGQWFKAGGDNAPFYTALSNCDSSRVFVVPDIVYNYNDENPLNDYKVNRQQQDRAIEQIVGKPAIVHAPQPVKPTVTMKKKKILIAVPTNRNIEATTFKSIYDLVVPDGYETVFQFFWGYQVDQVRNLIADWAMRNGFDYVFSVDSDISFPPDTLVRMLSHNVDIVSGVYIQRIQGTHTIEIMRANQWGGVSHVDWAEIKGQGLVPIDSCGFGCCLVKIEVYKAIPYPHFLYKSAIDHANTISEDVYFCLQAKQRGFKLWCDTDVICDHTGSSVYRVDRNMPAKRPENPVLSRLREIRYAVSMPQEHKNYLMGMKNNMSVEPQVIYDIGASTLHWYDCARSVWPSAKIIAFEAMEEAAMLYREAGVEHHIDLLTDTDGRTVKFYENKENPAGNSYYRENTKYSPAADVLYDEGHSVIKKGKTLDTIVKERGLPPPDLIKLDIQGAELDVFKGAGKTLASCNHLIVEMQQEEYNKGAPLRKEVIDYLKSVGFQLQGGMFSGDHLQGDYHFVRVTK